MFDRKSGPTRRHMGVSGLAKHALSKIKGDGFTSGPCLPAEDPTRGLMTNRVCSGDVNSAAACPPGYASFGYQPVGWNYGKACNEVDMKCVRSAYPMDDASVIACCTGATPSAKCDPSLCVGSDGCAARMRTMCATQAKYGTPECQTWMKQVGNEKARRDIMTTMCTANDIYGETPCRDFCLSSPGACDSLMNEYCARPKDLGCSDPADVAVLADCNARAGLMPNPFAGFIGQPKMVPDPACALLKTRCQIRSNYGSEDSVCSCINSPLRAIGEAVAPPSCYDDKCTASGYMTAGMKAINANCPDFTRCDAVINASNSSLIKNTKISQACGPKSAYGQAMAETKVTLPDEPGATSAPESVATPAPKNWRDTYNTPIAGNLATGDALIILFITIILLAVLYRRWETKKAVELETLSGGVKAAEQLAAQRAEMTRNQWQSTKNAALADAMDTMRPVGSA
jgi:hypothetical protein